MQTDLIIIKEYCHKCHIDPSFIILLEENGLIELQMVENEKYLLVSQLQELEKYTRLYYDLAVNIEGIDVIHHLLDKIRSMQHEIYWLKSCLRVYQTENPK